jgi:excisionase family DNA binding protein
VTNEENEQEVLLTPADVGRLFRVDPKTVTRWAVAGKLSSTRTLGGHRRFRQKEVMRLLEASAQDRVVEEGK